MIPGSEEALGRVAEEEILRFARTVAEWLPLQAGPPDGPPLVVFAAPQFLGMLRGCLPKAGLEGVRLVEGELTTLKPPELADHPMVVATLEQTSRAT
jgi:hypothetical protein